MYLFLEYRYKFLDSLLKYGNYQFLTYFKYIKIFTINELPDALDVSIKRISQKNNMIYSTKN